MNRRPRSAAVPLILLLFVTLAAGVLMGAARAKADPPTGSHDQRVLVGRPGTPTQPEFVAPHLNPVPDVVHNTTKKNPPSNVHFDGEPMGGGITGSGYATPSPGDVLIPGVPGYGWRDGCGPTAVGMVVGYYDLHGWDGLIPGDASSNTIDVQQAIASHGTAGAPGHYEDYALPKETTSAIVPDKSEAPVGDEHVSNCVADFMHTSWSAEGLTYGGSWTNMVGPAFIGYVNYRNSAYAPSSAGHYVGDPVSMTTWAVLKGEVDAGRPMVLIVDCTGDGRVDHAITGVGYRENGGLLEYAYLNTWDTGIHWAQYRPPSSTYLWGIWGVSTLSLSGWTPPDPPPPPPPPDPTPTPDPTPPADTTPPVTVVIGADDAWHGDSVELTFSATDIGSGVARTEASLDSGLVWREGVTLVVDEPGVHTVLFRSLDKAGNMEPERSCTVRIDSARPRTAAWAVRVKRGRTVSLRYRIGDLAPEARVMIVVKNARGKRVKTLPLGQRATNTDLTCRFVCKLRPAAYRYYVYATDPAGNTQKKPASARLTVR